MWLCVCVAVPSHFTSKRLHANEKQQEKEQSSQCQYPTTLHLWYQFTQTHSHTPETELILIYISNPPPLHTLNHIPVMAPAAAILDGYLETRNGQKKNQKLLETVAFFYPSPNFQQLFPNRQPAFTHIKKPRQSYPQHLVPHKETGWSTHKAGTHKTVVWVSVFWLRICF